VDFAFSQARHERAAERRSDDAWHSDPTLRLMLLTDELIATDDGPSVLWVEPSEAPPGEWILLGPQFVDGVEQLRAAVVVAEFAEGFASMSMRTLAPLLSAEEASFAVHAVAIARWLVGHTYCSRCGDYLSATQGGHLLNCAGCGAQHFPRTDPAGIVLVTDADDRALLARNASWDERRFSTLAGFVEAGESVEDAVRREVHEEVGVRIGEVRYAASQPWPFPSSLMLGFFASATTFDIVPDANEIAEADWFSRSELRRFVEEGQLILPPLGVSIARSLIDQWLAGGA
jgi:NAD+ diphosphatase